MELNRSPLYSDLLSWRKAQGVSQQEAADLLGISQSSYARFERGARYVRGPLAKKLTVLTGVPLDVLVGAR